MLPADKNAFLRALAISALFSVIGGCDRPTDGVSAVEKNVDDEGRPVSVMPGMEVATAGVVGNLNDWADEGLAIQAGNVMQELVSWLLSESDAGFPLPTSAEAEAMFPEAELEKVFNNGGLQVMRMGSTDDRRQPIADAAAALREQFRHLSERHGKSKVIGLHPGPASSDLTRMEVQVELYGLDAEGGESVQVNTRWETAWSASEGAPLLEQLLVRAFEMVRGKVSAGAVVFQDATARVLGDTAAYREDLRFGIDYWIERIEEQAGITIGGWNGLAVGDADGDGLDDLYVCANGGLPNRLFLRDDKGNLIERAKESGIDWLESTQSALFVDLDNDGDQDLVVGTLTGLLVHSNDGKGHFEVRAALPLPAAMPFSISAADYDLDGDLDLFAACYNHRQGITVAQRQLFEHPVPYHDATNGGRNVLLQNAGNWKFRHVTKAAGLDDHDRRFSYAASWEDYDLDGDPDLYIANDFGRNTLYRNDFAPGSGESARFTEVAAVAGVMDHAAGMSVDWGDYDNDGWADLYVSNMFSSAGSRISQMGKFLPDVEEETKALFQRHARGNSLFRNLGAGGKFSDVSVEQVVTLGRWAWGSKFVDLNNDGWRDLVVANGFITQPEDSGDL
ncbi:MAG: VCBS repeat-containing protein [Verrucomicrobiales bacterium]